MTAAHQGSLRCRGLVSDARGGFSLTEIEVASPGPGEVSVRMTASGICHTDHDSMRWAEPVVLGHEGAGVVTSVGAGVERCAVGDRVILNWAIPCGDCFQCRAGNQAICETHNFVTAGGGFFNAGHAHRGATRHRGEPIARSFNLGTLAEQTVVRAGAIVRVESAIPSTSACILGCGVMTGYGSVIHAARVERGASCVVLGCGGVGLNVVQACRIAGAATIVAVDLGDARLEMARRFGATHTLRARAEDDGLREIAAKVHELCGGRGADYAFECTAIPALGAAPLAMIRNAGVAVQVSGIEEEIRVDMTLFEWDKTYINPLYGQCQPDRDFPALLDLYAEGELLLDELVTRTYTLDTAQQAFDDMLAGRNAKGVVTFDA